MFVVLLHCVGAMPCACPKKTNCNVRIKNSIVAWYITQRLKFIDAYWKNPIDIQDRTLKNLLTAAKNTEIGKFYGFSEITNSSDFKNTLPVQQYDDFKIYVNRMMAGEDNLIWASKIKWFAKSSGTTNDKSKFLPISKEAFNQTHYLAGRDTLALYCRNNPNTEMFLGKGIIMGGSHSINTENPNIRSGDLSAVLLQNLIPLARYLSSIDLSISLMDDWEMKLQKLADQYIPLDVTSISGVPSWTLILLKKILEMTGKDHINEIWPNFEVYIHGGVSFEPYRDQFAKLLPSHKTKFIQTYNASEGFFGIQDTNEQDDMLLMLDYGIYYEFIPFNEFENEHPRTLSLEEVELGKIYAMVISTNAGLWRYNIGDTIQFTSLKPFRIKVVGRVKHFLNTFGEEVMVNNTDKALAKACTKLGLKVVEYTVAPIYMTDKNIGGHEWLIEFENPPQNLNQFAEILDSELKKVNSDYEAKRYKNLALQMPLIQVAKTNAFHNWLKSKNKLGGQHKIPRLFNKRIYLEEIMASFE